MPELAEKLAYSNPTTLSRVRNKKTFPDVERLQLLAHVNAPSGKIPNLHWLLTGEGPMMLDPEMEYRKKKRASTHVKVEALLNRLTDDKIEALRRLLS